MTYDRPLPPPLPPQGYLLEALGYVDEGMAAIALDVALDTLIGYRKAQIGPDYTIVGRTILYSRESLQRWLAAGGTRAFIENPNRPTLTLKFKEGAGHPTAKAEIDAVNERRKQAKAKCPSEVAKAAKAKPKRSAADTDA